MTEPSDRNKPSGQPAHRARPFDPAPNPGLSLKDFRRVCQNGFGDGHNSFAHSMAWYKNRLYVGTTRSNFQMVKIQRIFTDMPVEMWPVEGPDDAKGLYTLDRRAQIWRYEPHTYAWQEVQRAPMVPSIMDEGEVARETGLRTMAVFQGESDDEPVLYVATWAVSRSPGSLILRSVDGENFAPASDYGIIKDKNVTATRILVPFKGRLFTSPTGTRGLDVKFMINVSGLPVIFESRDPVKSDWVASCEPGFGDPANEGVFMLCPFNDQLYAGTFNCKGFELWRSDCEGNPPYKWTRVIEHGAYRGPLNQIVGSMTVFKGALYVGSAIQNGGFDRTNDIGPAGSELIRVFPDDSWELLVGTPRDTPDGPKNPLGGLPPGYGNLFNGYFWVMAVHDGWIYVGTMDSTIWVRWLKLDTYPPHARRLVEGVGVEQIVANEAGADLWRSADGENWMPVSRIGFDNEYNLGIRNLVSTPHGLFVAVANPFGPRVAVNRGGEWQYVDNPRGGLEIWQGTRNWPDDGSQMPDWSRHVPARGDV